MLKSGVRQAGAVFALVSALTLLSAWPLFRHFGTSLPSDLGDPVLVSWIFWWNSHQVPLTTAWWNAPIYWPMPGTFAMSETLLSLWPLTALLQWLGANPVATHNAAYLLSYPTAGAGAYLLAFRLTRRWDASLVAGLAFAFNQFRISHLPHLQLQWSCWMPLALAALHSYVDNRRPRALVAFAVCWMLNGFTNGYFLLFFPILLACWAAWFVRRWRDAFAIGATAVIASLPFLPLLAGYARWQRAFGFSRSIGEIREFGADLTAIFVSSSRDWLPAHWSAASRAEGELYPGIVIVALVIAGVVIARRRRPSDVRPSNVQRADQKDGHVRRWTIGRRTVAGLAILSALLAIAVMLTGGSELRLGAFTLSVHRPSRLLTFAFWFGVAALAMSPALRRAWRSQSALAFYAIAAAIMYFFALGPEPHLGATQILYKPPYAWLMYLPGFDSVRVPARFGLLMILCLSAGAAIAYARLFATPSRVRAAVLSLAVLAEGWIIMPVVALPAPLPVPQRIIAANAAIIELPVSTSFEANTIAMYNQLYHGRTLINGFSGYLPPHYFTLYIALDNLDATALDAVRGKAPAGVFVDAARDRPRPGDDQPNPERAQLAMVAAIPGAELVEQTDRGSWFLLPQQAPPADPVSAGALLKPSGVEVTATPDLASALTDGDPATRWFGTIHGESATDTIALTFSAPVRPDVVELDQGLWAASFARDLEIVAVTDAGRVTLYRGSLAAKAILGALASTDTAIKIPIANAPPASRIELISHPPSKKFTWSVGEIRIWGIR